MNGNVRGLVSLVVPVFNEEETVVPLVGEVVDALGEQPFEIVLVDDGSADGSFARCLEARERYGRVVRIVRLRRNFGQTAAMAAGFRHCRGEVVLPMDADMQNDPRDVPRLLAALAEDVDVVSGWRKERRDPFLSRRLPSIIANALISWITGVRLHDYGCTLTAYRASILANVALYGEMHRFLPALAFWAGGRIVELPVAHRPRLHGTSKYGLDRTLRVVLDLVTVKFLMSYSTRPMQVFGRWGVAALVGGGVFGLATVLTKVLPPHLDVTGNPYMYLTIFLVLGGLQLIALGLLGEISVRNWHESTSRPIYNVRQVVDAEEGP